jgi:hypothetical protein
MEAAAIIATVLLLILNLFQLALAAGAPWGAAAYGGGWEGVLPRGIRINSLVFGCSDINDYVVCHGFTSYFHKCQFTIST